MSEPLKQLSTTLLPSYFARGNDFDHDMRSHKLCRRYVELLSNFGLQSAYRQHESYVLHFIDIMNVSYPGKTINSEDVFF